MTVSANSTLDFTRDQLISMAYQATGLLEAGKEAPGEDLEMASNFMNLELMALQADGVVLRTIERATLTLGTPDAGTVATYTLPSDTIDLQLGPNDQIGTILNTDNTETTVVAMSRAEYMELSNKTADVTARSTRAYVEKQATVTVTLWPAPDSTSVSLKYARVRLLRDADDGAVTIDLARRWLKWVMLATAVHVGRAKSIPQDDLAELKAEAEIQKAKCLADDKQRGRTRFHVRHNVRRWA